MVVGPGGVVALIVGAWGVAWAVRVAPGRSWGALLPGIVAFGALLVAFPLLTAASEGALGFALAAHAEPAHRDGLRAEALGVAVRPLAATVFAFGAVVVATLLARLQAAPRPADTPVRLLDVSAAALVAALAVVGVADLLLLRGTIGRASAAGAALLPRAETTVWVAAGCAAALLGVAGAIGVARGLGPRLSRARPTG